MQMSFFENAQDVIQKKTNNLDELFLFLLDLKEGEVIYFKKREIKKDKFFVVCFGKNYEEIFHKPKQVIKFLTDEEKWLSRYHNTKSKTK